MEINYAVVFQDFLTKWQMIFATQEITTAHVSGEEVVPIV